MSTFVDSLHETFERFGRIEARRMFGGHGLFHEGRMFGLVTGDTLYLKSDAESVGHFDRLNLPAFEYERSGKTTQTSYREPPAEVFEDREVAALWARRAWEATLRSGHPPRKRAKAKAAPEAKPVAKKTPAAKKAPRKAAAR